MAALWEDDLDVLFYFRNIQGYLHGLPNLRKLPTFNATNVIKDDGHWNESMKYMGRKGVRLPNFY